MSCHADDLDDRKKRSASAGLIYINRLYYGRKPSDEDCDDDEDTSQDTCHVDGFRLWENEHYVDCNGHHECLDVAVPAALPDCNNVASSFLHVDYQCVEGKRYGVSRAVLFANKDMLSPDN